MARVLIFVPYAKVTSIPAGVLETIDADPTWYASMRRVTRDKMLAKGPLEDPEIEKHFAFDLSCPLQRYIHWFGAKVKLTHDVESPEAMESFSQFCASKAEDNDGVELCAFTMDESGVVKELMWIDLKKQH